MKHEFGEMLCCHLAGKVLLVACISKEILRNLVQSSEEKIETLILLHFLILTPENCEARSV